MVKYDQLIYREQVAFNHGLKKGWRIGLIAGFVAGVLAAVIVLGLPP